MVDAEEVLWRAETASTQDGVDALCRSFAERLSQLLLPAKIGEDLGRALAGIGTDLAGQRGSATRLFGELKRHKADLTLTLADDGAPLLHQAGRLRRPALQSVAARFPSHLYVPGSAQAQQKVNRFMIRTGTPEATTRPRILLVDDDPVQRLALSMFLRESYDTVACATAAEAELEAQLQPPDIIVSDLHMPEDDGLAFRDRLAGDPKLGPVPFLFLTSDRSPGAVAAANEAGIDDLIYKPADKRKLLAVLDRVLRRQAQLKALRQHSGTPMLPALPERVGRYTLATRRSGTSQDGPLLWHRGPSAAAGDRLQLLICAADGREDGTRQGFVKGAARGLDAGLDPPRFLDALTKLLGEEGLLDDSGLAATACRLDADGKIALADSGLCQAVRLTADGPCAFAGQLTPGERLVLTAGAPPETALPPDLFGRSPSAIVESLVQDLLIRSGGRAFLACVIGFD